MRKNAPFLVIALVAIGFTQLSYASPGGEWEKALQGMYTLSKRDFLSNTIKSPGDVVVLQVEGLMGNPLLPSELGGSHAVSNFADFEPGGLKLTYGSKSMSTKTFHPGDRFYISKINWALGFMTIELTSVDMYPLTIEGTSSNFPYGADIVIRINKEAFKTHTVGQFKQEDLDQLFKKETDIKNAPAPKLQLGMTVAEVEGMLGKPPKGCGEGAGGKLICKYPDWKITFTDGKVTDIE